MALVAILFFACAWVFFFALAETALFSLSKWQARQLAECASSRSATLADNTISRSWAALGANYFALATGYVASYLRDGRPGTPPVNQIENPEPRPGTVNWYTQSGYEGGSYVDCADPRQPGVKAIRDHLAALPYTPFNGGNCLPGHYYLVNNYRPGYAPDGTPKPLGAYAFTLPPQQQKTIAEALSVKGVRGNGTAAAALPTASTATNIATSVTR